ncbi:MAG: PEP-CTERM sorting domain-containing protein [Acidobacteriota bacterium]|nr:PEP-CTERM sorting domain-containing protein [Acidobacteriota bacterium]
MKSILIAGVNLSLLIASIASIPARAATLGITYSFAGALAGPPVLNGTMLAVEGLATGSILSGNSGLNATWNPVTFRDYSVVDLTTGLLNGVFNTTFANGDILSGNLFEATSGTPMGPFTQILTFTGGTGKFAGATGSASGGGFSNGAGFTVSGGGTLTAPGIVPEPASVALIFGGLLAVAATRKLVRQR